MNTYNTETMPTYCESLEHGLISKWSLNERTNKLMYVFASIFLLDKEKE